MASQWKMITKDINHTAHHYNNCCGDSLKLEHGGYKTYVATHMNKTSTAAVDA